MSPEEAEHIIRANWPPENYTRLREALEFVLVRSGQIEVLKEKLVEERAKTIATQELRESPEQAEEIGMRVTAGFSELPAWMTDHYRDVARQQLAEELKAAGAMQ